MPENNSGSMMGGFLLGAVLGAGLALIFAPMAGEETRRHIGDAARKPKDGTRNRLDHMTGTLKDRVGDVGAAIDAGKDAYRLSAERSSIDGQRV